MTKGVSLNHMLQERDAQISAMQRKIRELEETVLEMQVLFNRKMFLLERSTNRTKHRN